MSTSFFLSVRLGGGSPSPCASANPISERGERRKLTNDFSSSAGLGRLVRPPRHMGPPFVMGLSEGLLPRGMRGV